MKCDSSIPDPTDGDSDNFDMRVHRNHDSLFPVGPQKVIVIGFEIQGSPRRSS